MLNIKKILIISVGGNITAKPLASGILQSAPMTLARLRSSIPDLENRYFTIDFLEIMNVESELMQPNDWQKIAESIYQKYEEYDGFVVLHGKDTLTYTAAALSFILQNLSKPIVLTTSLMPLEFISSDAKRNIKDAIHVAAFADLAEVCVVVNGLIIRGCRVKNVRNNDFTIFDATDFAHLGTIRQKIELKNNVRKRKKRHLNFAPQLETNIGVFLVRPGYNPDIMNHMIDTHTKGIVILGFGSGSIPFSGKASLIPSIKNALERNIPVVIASQAAYGACSLSTIVGGHTPLKAGAFSAHDMTFETTIVKLMWMLGQTNDIPHIKDMLETNYVGEITPPIMDGAEDYFKL